MEPVAVTRRSRVRDATVAEIKATARTLLVAEGPEALTLRAIARAMGMTAPALYRYFDSHEALVPTASRACSRVTVISSRPGTRWGRTTRSAG